MSAPSIDDMRTALGLGPDVSDAAVVDAYVASLGFGIQVVTSPPSPSDPFASAAAALFRSPGSTAATYVSPDYASVPCRAIRSTNPVDIIIGNRTINAGATMIMLQCSDFADAGSAPVNGGQVIIGVAAWKLIARPRLDVEGVSWTCEAAEA